MPTAQGLPGRSDSGADGSRPPTSAAIGGRDLGTRAATAERGERILLSRDSRTCEHPAWRSSLTVVPFEGRVLDGREQDARLASSKTLESSRRQARLLNQARSCNHSGTRPEYLHILVPFSLPISLWHAPTRLLNSTAALRAALQAILGRRRAQHCGERPLEDAAEALRAPWSSKRR